MIERKSKPLKMFLVPCSCGTTLPSPKTMTARVLPGAAI